MRKWQHLEIWRKSVGGRGNSKRKASEKEMSLVHLHDQRKGGVAGAQESGGKG